MLQKNTIPYFNKITSKKFGFILVPGLVTFHNDPFTLTNMLNLYLQSILLVRINF